MEEELFSSSPSTSEDEGGSIYTNTDNSTDSDDENMNSFIVLGSSTWNSDDTSYNPSEDDMHVTNTGLAQTRGRRSTNCINNRENESSSIDSARHGSPRQMTTQTEMS